MIYLGACHRYCGVAGIPTRNPGGRKVPPKNLNDCTDPDMAAYVTHVTATIAMRFEKKEAPFLGPSGVYIMFVALVCAD